MPGRRRSEGPARLRHVLVPGLVVAAVAVAGCSGGVGSGGTYQPGVAQPTSVAPGPAGDSDRTSLSTASIKDVQAAFDSNGVDDAGHWAQVVVESDPYPPGPAGMQKLRGVLARFGADPDTTAKVTNTVVP